MNISNILFKIVIFLFLSTSYLSAIHIHHDSDKHKNKCEVCIVINNFLSADIPNNNIYSIVFEHNYFYEKILKESNIIYINKGYFSTAPPIC